MQPLKVYRVTKGSTDRSLLEGDIIWLSENGDLNINLGWLTKDEWDCPMTNDFTIEECMTHCVLKVDGKEMLIKKDLLEGAL